MRFLLLGGPSRRWADPDLGRHAVAARSALADHVAARVAADGAIRDRCRSRIFESALMLRLLQLEQSHPAVQARIAAHLARERRQRELVPFDQLLVSGVIAGVDAPDVALVERQLSIGERFASRRKRVMFRTVLAVMGIGRFEDCREEDFAHDGAYQSWVRIEMIALKILHAVHLGRRAWIAEDDILALTEAMKESRVREHMVLRQILALFALRSIPGQETWVRTGIERVLTTQDRDGGFPYVSGLEIFCTAVAGQALVGAGLEHGRATIAHMAEYLASHQQTNGGWAYAEGVEQTDVDDTVYCLELLRSAGYPWHAPHVSRATEYLLAMPGRDGGFPTFAAGAGSEIAMTAAAVGALACATPVNHVAAQVACSGVRYILDHQRADGTFERSWSLCETNAIFRVMAALRRFRAHAASETMQRLEASIDRAAARSQQYLRDAQNDDGGWGQVAGAASDVLSTSYALMALAHLGDRAAVHGGLRYLLACQRPDGGFVSIPDQTGPRPIPYDVPILADAFALLALDEALAAHSASPQGRTS